MDLFDHTAFFGSYIPVQARSHPLLKHAACACAAKQLSRAKGANAITTSDLSQEASTEAFYDSPIDWEREGAYHYYRSIALLIETMQQNQNKSSPNSPGDSAPASETSRYSGSVQGSKRKHSLIHEGTARLTSEIVVAAVRYSNTQRCLWQGLMQGLDSNTVRLRASQCDWRCMVAPPPCYEVAAGCRRRRHDALWRGASAAFQRQESDILEFCSSRLLCSV